MTAVRALIVSPRFAPSNAADSHRVRLLLPYLRQHGCSAEVLAVDPIDVRNPVDPWLADRLPADVPVHRVRAWPLSGWGLNGLAQRSVVQLSREGSALLSTGRFDLVFFSTTEFLLHALGPLWQRRHGVPFCMDYQDPWVEEYYGAHPAVRPPGGRLKFGVMNSLHRVAERFVVPRCGGFMAVSADYLRMLDDRYGGRVSWQPRLVASFPAEPAEYESLSRNAVNGTRAGVWRYVGAAGPQHRLAATAFFMAWQIAIETGVLARDAVRLEVMGTSYAPGDQPASLLPIGRQLGLEDVVVEKPVRVPYREMLSLLLSSDALVLIGADDPSYTASKLYPYLLAARPLLVITHEASSVVTVMRECGGGICVTFRCGADEGALAQLIFREWFASGAFRHPVPLMMDSFSRHTASAQASAVVEWFEQVLSAQRDVRPPGNGRA